MATPFDLGQTVFARQAELTRHLLRRQADMARLTLDFARMAAEAQMIIGLRMMGMAGVLKAAPSENRRMVAEKMAAGAASVRAAGLGIAAGRAPEKIAAAAVKPLRAKTRANAKRLGAAALTPKP